MVKGIGELSGGSTGSSFPKRNRLYPHHPLYTTPSIPILILSKVRMAA